MPPTPGVRKIESILGAWGVHGGVHALVLRWRKQVLAAEAVTLTWERRFDPGFAERQQASHEFGIFTLDAAGVEDQWLLRHEWRGWGWREYGHGDAHTMKSKALDLVRARGPFGGPEHLFRRASLFQTGPTADMQRHASASGELRIGNLVPGLGVLLHVKPDGRFAIRTLDPADRNAELATLAATLGPVETSVSGQRRVPWLIADIWPLLGVIRTAKFDLLSLRLTPEEVAVIAAKDEPYGILVGTSAQLRELNIDRWLASLPSTPLVREYSPPPSDRHLIASATVKPDSLTSRPAPPPARPPATAGNDPASDPYPAASTTVKGYIPPEPMASPPSRTAAPAPTPTSSTNRPAPNPPPPAATAASTPPEPPVSPTNRSAPTRPPATAVNAPPSNRHPTASATVKGYIPPEPMASPPRRTATAVPTPTSPTIRPAPSPPQPAAAAEGAPPKPPSSPPSHSASSPPPPAATAASEPTLRPAPRPPPPAAPSPPPPAAPSPPPSAATAASAPLEQPTPPTGPPPSPPQPAATTTSVPPEPIAPPGPPPGPPASSTSPPPEPSASPPPHPAPSTSPPPFLATAARVEPTQAMKLPPALIDALAACFAVVEGDLPVRQTGAEFARELVWVLVRAASAGATTMTGTPAELLRTLHRLGYLRAVPSDQVGRDAFKMLAARTSLVRRIHHRRWRLAFGDLLNPDSTLREELRRYEPT